MKGGWLSYTHQKNRRRKPMRVEVPMPSELVAAIEACPRPPEALTFLTTERGRPFTKDHFGDTMGCRGRIAAPLHAAWPS